MVIPKILEFGEVSVRRVIPKYIQNMKSPNNFHSGTIWASWVGCVNFESTETNLKLNCPKKEKRCHPKLLEFQSSPCHFWMCQSQEVSIPDIP